MTTTRIAFLGIGLMGSRQVPRLTASGFPVTVWNRSPGKAEAMAGHGADVALDPAEAAAGADVVITMLADGRTVGAVLFEAGVAAAMRPGATLVDMSSIAPAEARDHAARLAARGIRHLDAPVSGGTVGAEQGTLTIMAGGDPQVFAELAPVLAPMGRSTLVGGSGAGQVAKLANQMIVGITIGAVAEALLFAERAGADPALVRAALRGGFADSRILELHGQRMVDRDFVTRGKTSIQIKDLRNALATAGPAGAPMPFTGLAESLFQATLERCGDLDHSGLWQGLAEGVAG